MALLGLPRIGWHGPLYRLGYMSPTCGLTRGVQHMFQGDVFTAALFNPAAPVLVLGAAAAILRWIVGRTTGHWLGFEVEHSHRAVRAAFLATIATLFILLWINQQLNAGFLLTH